MSEQCMECYQPVLGEGPNWCALCSYARGKADGMAEVRELLAKHANELQESYNLGADDEVAKIIARLRAQAKDLEAHAEVALQAGHDAANLYNNAAWRKREANKLERKDNRR